MSVPQLNRKLVLETPNRVADGAGGYSTTWAILGTHWAKISGAKGRAIPGDAGLVSRVPMSIIVRAFPVGAQARPKPGQRLVDGNRRFAIRAVSEFDQAARFLELTCDEEVAT